MHLNLIALHSRLMATKHFPFDYGWETFACEYITVCSVIQLADGKCWGTLAQRKTSHSKMSCVFSKHIRCIVSYVTFSMGLFFTEHFKKLVGFIRTGCDRHPLLNSYEFQENCNLVVVVIVRVAIAWIFRTLKASTVSIWSYWCVEFRFEIEGEINIVVKWQFTRNYTVETINRQAQNCTFSFVEL